MKLWKRRTPSESPVAELEQDAAAPPSYRLAAKDDAAALARIGDRLLGTGLLDWPGMAAADRDALVIVAERSDGTVGGMIGLTPLHIRSGQIVSARKRDRGVEDYPWWKLRGLALEPDLRGQGAARELLRRAVEGLPPEIVGVYGNVDLANLHAAAWYHRQGFHLAGAVRITGRGAPINLSAPGELFFRASTKRLTDHLAGRPNAREDARLLRDEFKSLALLHVDGRTDVGYRLFARRVAEAARADNTCAHLAINHQPSVVLGWDPAHRRVCTACHLDYSMDPAVVAHDAKDLCDGCGRRDGAVLQCAAALEEEHLIVHAGLCPTCRAGDLPAVEP
jgi:GNAT superfamily N-acetyltransferase